MESFSVDHVDPASQREACRIDQSQNVLLINKSCKLDVLGNTLCADRAPACNSIDRPVEMQVADQQFQLSDSAPWLRVVDII